MWSEKKAKGRFLQGSIDSGLEVILNDEESIEDYPVGALVKIESEKNEFLGLITNVKIESLSGGESLLSNNRIGTDVKLSMIKSNPSIYRRQILEISLIAKLNKETDEQTRADILPSFNSPLLHLDKKDISKFYGSVEEGYIVGKPKSVGTVEVDIPLNIESLIDLSFAIYGKSGSGKTFLGNILAGYITLYDLNVDKNKQKGVKLLIFDMHSEYGLGLKDNRGNVINLGVGSIFRNFYDIYTPDLQLADDRNLNALKINVKDIEPDDLKLIGPIFGLTRTFMDHIYTIRRIIGRKLGDRDNLKDYWFLCLFDGDQLEEELGKTDEGITILNKIIERLDLKDISELKNKVFNLIKDSEGYQVAQSYRSQTSKLRRFLRYPLTMKEDIIGEIVDRLLTGENHVIISMGKYEKETPLYMIIANLLARRLRNRIMEMEEAGEEIQNKIIIFLEEAHNFLSRENYNLSPFGDIAREMRKKGVTLCVIDQKPSELDPNVVSMVWTSFVFNLTDRRDVEQAIIGIDKPQLYRSIVPTLSPREVLAFGESIKYPVVVKVRDYAEVEKEFKEISENYNKMVKEREGELREGGFI